DSDFSPLVAKLRENNKGVIGLGVKNSTSDLLIASCDEFIYYDDLVREQKSRRGTRKRSAGSESAAATPAAASNGNNGPAPAEAGPGVPPGGEGKERDEDRKQEAFDLVLQTVEALMAERGEEGKVWGSMVKQALKRVRPGFSESYYGFRSFNRLLEEAADRRLLTLERDDKSGGYLIHTLAEG
ncbi:MAG: NYN domain-containing protein, partial [Steroidobacteraceae bacterium]